MGKVIPNKARRTDSGLKPNQEEAAALLAVGTSIAEVGRKVGVNRNTVYEWLRLPEFAAFYKRQLRDVRREIQGKLSAMAEEATNTLETLMRDGGEQSKLKAATYILDRIAENEKLVKKTKQQHKNEKG